MTANFQDLVALMAQASAQPVRTFTVAFSDKRYDERNHARAVAERYSTTHEELDGLRASGATACRLRCCGMSSAPQRRRLMRTKQCDGMYLMTRSSSRGTPGRRLLGSGGSRSMTCKITSNGLSE